MRRLVDPPLPSGSESLELVRADLLAMPTEALIRIYTDIPSAGIVVTKASRDVQRYRGAIAARFGEAAAGSLDRLEVLAAAAVQADARCRVVPKRIDLEPYVSVLRPMRDIMVGELRQLILRGLLPAGVLAELSGKPGHLNLVVDTLQLVSVFQLNAAVIGTQSGVTMEYVERAETAASLLSDALADGRSPAYLEAADLRQRAFSLLWHTYDDARRWVTCLRWKERDYDQLVPPMCGARGPRRRVEEEDEVPEEAPADDAAPIRPGMPGAPPFAEGGAG